jgi:hypothetical protein
MSPSKNRRNWLDKVPTVSNSVSAEDQVTYLRQQMHDAQDRAANWECAYNGVRIELRDAREKVAALVAIGERILETEGDDPCWADHHGYCQAHGLEPVEDCWVKRLHEAVQRAKGEQ